MTTSKILVTKSTADYALLDSGDGEKLERFGKVVLSRPDPQALWTKKLSPAEWKKVDGHLFMKKAAVNGRSNQAFRQNGRFLLVV